VIPHKKNDVNNTHHITKLEEMISIKIKTSIHYTKTDNETERWIRSVKHLYLCGRLLCLLALFDGT